MIVGATEDEPVSVCRVKASLANGRTSYVADYRVEVGTGAVRFAVRIRVSTGGRSQRPLDVGYTNVGYMAQVGRLVSGRYISLLWPDSARLARGYRTEQD